MNDGNRFSLHGRLALVTGGYGEFGAHFSQLLLDAGAAVVVAGRNDDKRDTQVDTLQRASPDAAQRVHQAALDVADADSVRHCFDDIEQRIGTPDIIVNNAGTTATAKLLEHTESDWQQVIDTNLSGSWRVAQEAARRLSAASMPGTIINIASILGARVAGGVAPYCVAKAGLIQMTQSLALELARHRIRANALLPGYVITDLNRDFLQSDAGDKLKARIPSRRFGELHDLDGPFLLLASDAGAHMTGAQISVDGGHLVSSL